MAREFAKQFYNSSKWQSVRKDVLFHSGGLCEECLKKGLIRTADVVHHKIILTPENINNPEVSLNPEHLVALCADCHAAVHAEADHGRRYFVNANGEIVIAPLSD